MTRVKITEQQVNYDSSHDILHVFFYPEHLSIDDEEFPGIVIRRSVEDERITGLTIMDFSRCNNEVLDNLLPEYDFSTIQH
jgi:hypothetical protein